MTSVHRPSLTEVSMRERARAPGMPVSRWLQVVSVIALASAGCAQGPTAGRAGSPTIEEPPNPAAPGAIYSLFHPTLKAPPEGKLEVMRLHGEGVQIFRCEAQGDTRRWNYRLPEAELRDGRGATRIRHGANQTFEDVDGSHLVGDILDHVASPVEGALPWLLLSTKSFGTGELAAVSHVQRINTVGGMPPASCDSAQLGQVLRVPFHADFVFYR
jgi:hypothetical protein